jgi:hypothetical protein
MDLKRRFGGIYLPHLQVRIIIHVANQNEAELCFVPASCRLLALFIIWLWRWKWYILRNVGRLSTNYMALYHSRSSALLEKLPIVQLLKNSPAFYGTRRFFTVFTRPLHWSLSWARSIQSNPIHTILFNLPKIQINIVHPLMSWSSQLSLSFWLSHRYLICIHIFSNRATCPAHLIFIDMIILIIFGEEYKFDWYISSHKWKYGLPSLSF